MPAIKRLRRFAPYAALSSTYVAGVGGFAAWMHRTRHPVPESIKPSDLALLGVATYKLSRLGTKDKVTSFIRAPFREKSEPGLPGETNDEPGGTGMKRAIGELLTCPFCFGQWVGTGLALAYLVRPRETRLAASILTIVTVAETMQYAEAALRQTVE